MNKNTRRARKLGLSCQPSRLEGKNSASGNMIHEIHRNCPPVVKGYEVTQGFSLSRRKKSYPCNGPSLFDQRMSMS